ncbi:MAG: hypothetical protein WAK33_04915 [Silvibacterium sp.]
MRSFRPEGLGLNAILRHLELVLSSVGIVVIFAVPMLFFRRPDLRWEAAAITAAAVGVIHGIIFYAVRRRQRLIRRDTIREMQLVVDDIVRNQLTVIGLSAALARESSHTEGRLEDWAERSINAAHEIGHQLKAIDSERLHALIRRSTAVNRTRH